MRPREPKAGAINAVAGEQAPGDPRILVCERDGANVGVSPLLHFSEPPASWTLFFSNPPKYGASAVAVTGPIPFDLAETLTDLAVATELSDLAAATGNLRIPFGQFFPQLSYERANKGTERTVIVVADEAMRFALLALGGPDATPRQREMDSNAVERYSPDRPQS